jgi:DNA-binding winged helix-turn-helix (wHTH) protein/tetratricopeptide (TPR) repeat protein
LQAIGSLKEQIMTGTATPSVLSFGPYRLDPANARLLRDGEPVSLTPKALDLLGHLARRPQSLVTKAELLSAVWPDVIVSDASVKVCINEIRKALDDGAKTPTYIQTVHRRGYRFIAAVESAGATTATTAAAAMPSSDAALVGRDVELRRLAACFAMAEGGRRQCTFICGGPGSGKTALGEAFLRHLADTSDTRAVILAGHCFQQFGSSEPYMPVWEAIGHLSRDAMGASGALRSLLARHAAAQTTTGGADGRDAQPGPPVQPLADAGTSSDRLLREIADAIEALAADGPVVLFLEDVHWADYSTIDLISALARRRAAARLMIVATYRPTELARCSSDHPLASVVHELRSAGLCGEISLGYLDEPAVAEYLAARFPAATERHLPRELSRRLHQRTGGHPLFLVHLVDDLVAQGVIVERGGGWHLAELPADEDEEGSADPKPAGWLAVLETLVPQSVRAMIESHLERLGSASRLALEAAAVAGFECCAAAVAGGLGSDVIDVEQTCDELARRHRFLEPHGVAEWPDGTACAQYRFVHQMFHDVVYEQVPPARRARMHQLVGLAIEAAWGERSAEEAAGLAMHFEMGRDWGRVARYLQQAAHAAGQQYAHREAAHYLSRALAALDRLSGGARSADQELAVLHHLAVALQATRGFAAQEVEAIHARAYELCRANDDIARTFPVRWSIWLFHKVRSDLRTARSMCNELLAMASVGGGDSRLLLQAHQAMCVTHLCLGAPAVARDHAERAAAVYDPAVHAANAATFGLDPGVATAAFGAVALWLLDCPEEALRSSERALELGRRLNQPSSLAMAMHFAAMLHQLRGDAPATAHWAMETIGLATQEGFSFWLAGGQILRGWARVALLAGTGPEIEGEADVQGGIAEIRRGLDAWMATGSRTYQTYFLGLLGDALQRLGRNAESLEVLDEALAAAGALPEGLYEAELHRLRGCALAQVDAESEARACFKKAIEVARGQGARWFERRARSELRLYPRAPSPASASNAATTSGANILPPCDRTNSIAGAGSQARL